MPNTREKLIDVFMHLDRHIQNRDEYGICYTSDFVKAIEDVMEILKNGVTVQQWIPVTERLPENSGTYIVTTESGAVTTARFYEEATYPPTHYRSYEYHRSASWSRNRHVTHWMPLPEAPKEGVDNGQA